MNKIPSCASTYHDAQMDSLNDGFIREDGHFKDSTLDLLRARADNVAHRDVPLLLYLKCAVFIHLYGLS